MALNVYERGIQDVYDFISEIFGETGFETGCNLQNTTYTLYKRLVLRMLHAVLDYRH